MIEQEHFPPLGWHPNGPPKLDPGIARAVNTLRQWGVQTYESCEGGEDHAYSEPTVAFHGGYAEGLRAMSIAIYCGLPVKDFCRVWRYSQGEVTGPHCELIFWCKVPEINNCCP